MDIRHIRLELDVDLEKKRVDGVATLSLVPEQPVHSVKLDAVDFDTKSVELNGSPARYVNDGRSIEVYFGQAAPAGQEMTVRIAYSVQDPKSGLHFYQPSDDDPEAPYQVWSQGQAEDNRYWIPCFDNPNERQTTETIITADEQYEVLSNGTLVSVTPAGGLRSAAAGTGSSKSEAAGSNGAAAGAAGAGAGGPPPSGKKRWHWRQDETHVAYLVTLVVGDFHIKEEKWRGKPVQYWVPEERKEDIPNSFANTTRMLDFFSDKIGVEYPWPKYVQICCYQYGGGMENTSATTLGENTLHDKRAHLDTSSDGLVAHELAHQWWGDYVTCNSWTHLWLNEGFASYFEALWDEQNEGPDEFAVNMMDKAQAAIDGGRARPIVDRYYGGPGEMFDSRAYPKGAWVLHMMRRQAGDEAFWKIMNRWCTRHKLDLVDTDHLRDVAEEVTGRSWERFFYDWTQRAGCPALDVTYSWDEGAKTATLAVRQTQHESKEQLDKIGEQWRAPAKEAFHFPLMLEFRFAGKIEPISVTRDVDERAETIVVKLPEAPTMVRTDPQQAVLMELKENKPRDLWAAQLSGDPNPVGRIRAARELAGNKSDANRQALADALAKDSFYAVQREIAQALAGMEGDIARDALLAGLEFRNSKARRACIEQLSRFRGDPGVIDAVRKCIAAGDESYWCEEAAIESYAKLAADDVVTVVTPALERPSHRDMIRRAVLAALGGVDDAAAVETLQSWLDASKPRECRQAAATALGRTGGRGKLDPETEAQVVRMLIECVEHPRDRQLSASAARALGEMGHRATSAVDSLREVSERHRSERVRSAARDAMGKIQKDAPAEKQISDVRKEVETLRSEKQALEDRLKSLEARIP